MRKKVLSLVLIFVLVFNFMYGCSDLNNPQEPVKFSVEFVTGGGSSVSAQQIPEGSFAGCPQDPLRDGYIFSGWYSDSGYETKYIFSAPVTQSLKLYAKWHKALGTFTVEFMTGGGSMIDAQHVEEGNYAGRPNDPVRDGFTFAGWYSDPGYEAVYIFSAPVTQDLKLYAKWDNASGLFSVEFDTGSDSIIATQHIGKGNYAGRPADPVLQGFAFAGWYSDSGYNTQYIFSDAVTQNLKLYAKWEKDPDVFSVEFDPGNGGQIPAQYISGGGYAGRPDDPERYGFIFSGWYQDQECRIPFSFSVQITQNLKLHAKWDNAPDIFLVEFDTQGGGDIGAQYITEGGYAVYPDNPERSGFSFEGWYRDKACGIPFRFSAPVTQNLKLYAKWTKTGGLTVEFVCGNGDTLAPQDIKEGNYAGRPADPVKEGYTFAGWYADPGYGALYVFSTPVTQSLTLYAKWDKNPEKYLVEFYPGNGSAIAAQHIKEGNYAGRPADPMLDGFTFAGWYIDPGFTTLFVFSTSVTQNFKLYARWNKNADVFLVEFITGGGSTIATQHIREGNYAGRPADPTLNGFTFAGWYSDPGYGTIFIFSTTISKDFKLYAKWEKALETFSVEFFPGNGSLIEKQHVTEGNYAGRPADPVREGYTFAGWCTDPEFTALFIFSDKVTQDLKLYARWSKTPDIFIVEFDTCGGSDIDKQYITEGNYAGRPADPVREGYTFAGWYSDPGFMALFVFSAPITQDIKLYAKWDKNADIFSVEFITGGGSTIATQHIREGNYAGCPEDPTLDGYTFAGWYSDPGYGTIFIFSTTISQNLKLYAKWNKNTDMFSVEFITGGGSPVETQYISEGNYSERPADPVREGFIFAGWYSDPEFTAPFIFSVMVTQNLKLYAKWEENAPVYEVDLSERADHLIINQIYGLGTKSNDGQAGSHSFVELYNPTSQSISLSGYSLHAAPGGNVWDKLNLAGTVLPYHSFLIVLTKYTNPSARLYIGRYDMEWENVSFSNKNLKVALMSDALPLTTANPFLDRTDAYVDMIGFMGNDSAEAIDGYETSYLAEQSKQKAARRKTFLDTDNNETDIDVIDYREADLYNYGPRSLADGAWFGNVMLTLSREPGMYTEGFNLQISNVIKNPQLEIRYTVDGTEPTMDSGIYDAEAGILIDDKTDLWSNHPLTSHAASFVPRSPTQCPANNARTLRGTALRVRAFIDGNIAADTVTATYIVAADIMERYRGLPIVSVTAPEGEFLNMYTDYREEIISQFNYEYFDYTDGEYRQIFNLPGETKLGGEYTKEFGQKTLNVNLSKSPLSGNVKYPVIDGVSNLKRFRLWNGGNMFETGEYLRDLFLQRTAKDFMDIGEARLVITFVNGEYWGFCHLRESISKDYAETHFGTDKNNFAQIKTVTVSTDPLPGGKNYYAHAVDDGDEAVVTALYDELTDYVVNTDFSAAGSYETLISDYFDEDNLINYILINLYYGNVDWPHNNIRMYRAITPQASGGKNDGKWRFFLYDMDLAMGGYGSMQPSTDTIRILKDPSLNPESAKAVGPAFIQLFIKLFENQVFKEKMLIRALELVENVFIAERSVALYTAMMNETEPLCAEMWQRYRTLSMRTMLKNNTINFLNGRNTYFMGIIETHCAVSG